MADLKISQLTAASEAAAANEIPINASGASKKVTVAQIFGLLYPVGSIYISTLSTNPATLLGVGTWSAFAAGKTLVGLDSGDTDFDTVEETGGEKIVKLTAAQSGLPAHTHPVKSNDNQYDIGIGGTLAGGVLDAYGRNLSTDKATATANSAANASEAHNNLQPYIVVYMWKRTA